MVKAERYFFSNWPLQLLPSRPWRESSEQIGIAHAPRVLLCVPTRDTRVASNPMGVNLFHNGQLCARALTNKMSLRHSGF
jgi:hypothetical protein